MPTEKPLDFKDSSRRLLRHAAARSGSPSWLLLAFGVASVALSVLGPKILGHATDLIFAGVVGQQLPAGVTKAAGGRRRCGPRATTGSPTCSRDERRSPVRASTSARSARCCCWVLVIYVVASLFAAGPGPADHAGRAARRLPAARAGRGEAVPAAAELLRPAAARRGAQPGHQRHRQHRADPAADDEPARHLGADHRRRAGHDVLDLAAAGGHRAGHRAGVHCGRRAGRQAGAAAVHPAVGHHRQAQRPHRGDVHRARAGEDVRPAGGGGRRRSTSTTSSCTGRASGPSSSPASSSRR